MTGAKTTKRSLFTSIVALLLCFSMLLGTTFAWFTDSVTSENNIIKSGNLDITLEYYNGSEWLTVEGASDILAGNLWEPGYVDVAYLRMKNAGSLALKYNLGVNIVSETTGKNVNGEEFKLSDYIYFDIFEDVNGETGFGTRENALKNTTKTALISDGYYKSGSLLENSDYVYLAMVVYMPESVGNEANHDGENIPEINLGINVFATQYAYEEDSFDDQYDAGTATFTVADAQAMINNNMDVTLMDCNEPDKILYVPSDYTGTLTLNNVKIAGIKEGDAPSAYSLLSVADENESSETDSTTNIVILGNVVVKAKEDNTSAITGTNINISGTGCLTVVAKGNYAYGIGGSNTKSITVKGITIGYAEGGHAYGVGEDTKYYKDAPTGGAAIGSGYDGAVITLDNVTVVKAIGGSKAAGIGANYHVGVTVNIKDSTIGYVEGGVSAAGIGGSRVSNGATESGTTINITNSNITAVGGVYAAGIGSGYDTYCQKVQPLCTINISDSTIKANGGKYAAGVGTGYHNAALAGEIKNSNVTAASGDNWYKDSYTSAMDIGFGVTDPAREGVQTESKLVYGEQVITLTEAPVLVYLADGLYQNANTNAYSVFNANGLETLNAMMNDGTAGKEVVVNIMSDIDFTGKTWTPVDAHYEFKFSLKEINGNGHTVSNFSVNGAAMFTRFVCYSNDSVIRNVTFDNATVDSNNNLNTALFINQAYTNVTIDNVNVINSSITGGYKVATLVGTVYNESSSSVALTVKNTNVDNCTVTSTLYDFMTCGLVAFVYVSDNDKVVFENTSISNVTLKNNKSSGYSYHAFVYYNDQDTDDCFNEAEGVTVTNCTFLSKMSDGLYADENGNLYVYNAAGLQAMKDWMDANAYRAFWGKTYNIMADIDASDVVWNTKHLTPDSSYAKGITFNGNGHTISNLTINGQGLFTGATKGGNATVPSSFTNVTFDNVTVNGGSHHNGVVWGEAYDSLTLNKVSVINSKVSGGCNVGALVGRNSECHAVFTFIDCSVKNTTVEATKKADNAGASAFLGMALHINGACSANVIFEGNNVAENNTLITADGMQGGGIYTCATWGDATWDAPVVVNDFTNYNSNN